MMAAKDLGKPAFATTGGTPAPLPFGGCVGSSGAQNANLTGAHQNSLIPV
jgi:hypothetical protein